MVHGLFAVPRPPVKGETAFRLPASLLRSLAFRTVLFPSGVLVTTRGAPSAETGASSGNTKVKLRTHKRQRAKPTLIRPFPAFPSRGDLSTDTIDLDILSLYILKLKSSRPPCTPFRSRHSLYYFIPTQAIFGHSTIRISVVRSRHLVPFTILFSIRQEKPPMKTQLNIDITPAVLQNKAAKRGRK